MATIKKVQTELVINLRHKVLRPHQKREDCYYPGDDAPTTIHFAAFDEDKVIGIATIYQEKHPTLTQSLQYRLRGMATDPVVRGQGVGAELISAIKNEIKNQVLWFNARIAAQGFYEKLGFQIISDEFDIPGIGPHYVMAINHLNDKE
jgi:predicted GNAT family N-acyltransferase